ncbi:FMR1 neighbor [Ictidomys tridecemlineatus]|nr:FMR1 neighbor [Ictidomys tridecemlineatus]
MPSELRSTRRRTRSKSRAVRGARARLVSCEAGCKVENPATATHPRNIISGREAIMAAMPQTSWLTSLRGFRAKTRQSLIKMWARRRLGFVMLSIMALLLLGCYFSCGFSDSVTANELILWKNKDADGQSLEETSTWKTLLIFLFPTTCIVKENQEVKPCKELENLNETECLRYKCCFSSSGIKDLSCFTPLPDKPTQMVRMFGLGVISMITLGCLPIYCCSLCQRSKWANPLRRKVNRMLKGLKKQRNKPKSDAEMLGTAMEDEEGDEKEQETKGNQFIVGHKVEALNL